MSKLKNQINQLQNQQQIKNPLSSNLYLNALIRSSNNNNAKLVEKRNEKTQQLQSLKRLNPEISLAKEIILRMQQKKSRTPFIPNYGFLNNEDIKGRNVNSVVNDVQNRQFVNQSKQDLMPYIEFEDVGGQQVPVDLLSKQELRDMKKDRNTTEKQKKSLLQQILTKPDDNTELIRQFDNLDTQQQIIDNNQRALLQQIIIKPVSDNAALVQAIEDSTKEATYNNALQLETQKYKQLMKMITIQGQEKILEEIEKGRFNMGIIDQVKIVIQQLKLFIGDPAFQQYLVKNADTLRQQEIKDILTQQYQLSLTRQTANTSAQVVAQTSNPLLLPSSTSTPSPTLLRPIAIPGAPVSIAVPIPGTGTPVPSGSTPVASGSTPVPASVSTPVPSGSTPIPKAATPIPIPVPVAKTTSLLGLSTVTIKDRDISYGNFDYDDIKLLSSNQIKHEISLLKSKHNIDVDSTGTSQKTRGNFWKAIQLLQTTDRDAYELVEKQAKDQTKKDAEDARQKADDEADEKERLEFSDKVTKINEDKKLEEKRLKTKKDENAYKKRQELIDAKARSQAKALVEEQEKVQKRIDAQTAKDAAAEAKRLDISSKQKALTSLKTSQKGSTVPASTQLVLDAAAAAAAAAAPP